MALHDAYIAQARAKHPDAGGTTEEFTELVLAYKSVETGKDRKTYDKKLRLTMDECKKCSGLGVTYAPRTNAPSVCKTCKGVGLHERS